jgi:hypothetical protein
MDATPWIRNSRAVATPTGQDALLATAYSAISAVGVITRVLGLRPLRT